MGHGRPPVRTSYDWPVLLWEAGLHDPATRSFLLDRPAPVGDDVRDHVTARLEHVRDLQGDNLSASDRAALDRLLDADHALGVRRRADLFYFAAYTVHLARKP